METSNTHDSSEPMGGIITDTVIASNPALAFVNAYKVPLLIAFIIMVAGGFYGYQYLTIKAKNIQIGNLKNKVEHLEQLANHYESESNKCSTNFADLSKKVQNLSDQSSVLVNKMNSIVPVIKDIAKNTDTTVTNITNKPIPKTCEEAMQFIKDNIGDSQW